MSHIIGYVDKWWTAYYGIEEYFNKELAGDDGEIIGLVTPWIGQVWANNFEIASAQDGVDIYLTIDPIIQKEAESRATYYHDIFDADGVAVTIIDPKTAKVKAMVNAPWYDSNEAEELYKIRPMTYNERYVIEDETHIDIPLFFLSWEDLRQATVDERLVPDVRKYIFDNMLWPQTFVDKNIAFPYEPWSIFKTIALAIAVDSDSLSMYDFYNDPGFVDIWPYTIANISDKCEWDNTYLHALEFSCNVGMVRMAQQMTKYIFYAYLEKLWFGQPTGIELAWEDGGTLPDYNTISVARFFNNTFWQWLLATPLQMATAYSSLINGWYYIQPTVVEAIYDKNQWAYINLSRKNTWKVFKDSTSEDMKEALVSVVDNGNLVSLKKEWFSLWGKTGTSEIAFRGKYQWWAGRTNGSFVGLVTQDEPKYVIAVQVRRPRSSPWWSQTAAKVFASIADFLIAYEKIES